MNKHLCSGVVIVGLVSLIAILFLNQHTAEAPHNSFDETAEEMTNTSSTTESTTTPPAPALDVAPQPSDTFTGKLTEVHTGCFADGECYAVVDGKHVTLVIGRSQGVVGNVAGALSIGDLESYVGQIASVYAKPLSHDTYTLYGNQSYYLAVTPKSNGGCVVGGCSSHLCVEEGADVVTSCEWTAKYSCYQTATCERQPSGQCGWTETPKLLACIADAGSAPAVIQ